jgi:hypothetical protein
VPRQILHTRKRALRTFAAVRENPRPESLMSINNEPVESVVHVSADFEDLAPLQALDAPVSGEFVTVIGERSSHVVVRAEKWAHLNSHRVVALPVRLLRIPHTAHL